jgi:hypothetical protein
VRSERSPAEVERLFLGAVDEALSKDEEALFATELEADAALKARFDAYRGAVRSLRQSPKERAPDGLASLILRRSRRRRFHLKRGDEEVAFRVPAEVLIPLLLAALVALLMLLASP